MGGGVRHTPTGRLYIIEKGSPSRKELVRFFPNRKMGGVPREQQTTTHRKDGRVTPCVAYGTVADKIQVSHSGGLWSLIPKGVEAGFNGDED